MTTNVMISGLPGKAASKLMEAIRVSGDMKLVSGLKGTHYTEDIYNGVCLYPPEKHEEGLSRNMKLYPGNLIVVDFTTPQAVNRNAELYAKLQVPFVMGTTGGDREKLCKTVEESNISAVIAPNMAKQIVAFQAMMEYAAQKFPGVFRGYQLKIRESHQKEKVDTSGTAKAMVGYFNKLGIPFKPEQIVKERDPAKQREMGIPEEHLGGHGWHTYTLTSEDGTVLLEFTHNVNGREIYAAGTIDAIRFLYGKVTEGKGKGIVYSMIDVLSENRSLLKV